MTKNTSIQNRVRLLRQARALTQQDLGDLLGVSRQTVNAIENGRYEPALRLAFAISATFAARIEDVFRPADGHKSYWSPLMIIMPDQLITDAAVLRPHQPSDLAAFERFLLDHEATRYMAFTPEQKTSEGAAAMMDAVIGSYSSSTPICSMTIADPKTNSYLGAVGAAEAEANGMEVFVTLLPEAQGKGLATEAMHAMAGHLFETSGATKLIADILAENHAAIRLFEGLGFNRQAEINRAAQDGSLGHRAMNGIRFVLSRAQYRKGRAS